MWRSRLFNGILSADVLAPSFNLNIDGQLGVRTLLGVVLTCLWIFGLLAGNYYSFLGYLNTNSPISSAESIQMSSYPSVDLKYSSLVPMIFMYVGDTYTIPVEEINKYATIFANLRVWKTRW